MRKNSLEYQLGYYVGEYIYSRYLPTLSTDSLKSRKVINVSDEETAEHERLNAEWYKSYSRLNESGIEWKALRAHDHALQLKYLPHTLVCHVPQVSAENHEEFKKGIIDCLWDTDLCSYSLKPENIKIGNEKDYFTCIEFVLGVTVNEL